MLTSVCARATSACGGSFPSNWGEAQEGIKIPSATVEQQNAQQTRSQRRLCSTNRHSVTKTGIILRLAVGVPRIRALLSVSYQRSRTRDPLRAISYMTSCRCYIIRTNFFDVGVLPFSPRALQSRQLPIMFFGGGSDCHLRHPSLHATSITP